MDFSYRKIWTITYPVLISLLMQNIVGMTDTAFMGRVGEIELGASALAGIYYMVIYMIGFGFSVGAEILIGRRNGEGNLRAVGKVFHHAAIILTVMALVMILFTNLFSSVLLRGIIESDAVYAAAMKYTNWRIYGLLFSFAAILFRAYFMGTTKTRILTINSLVMVLSNVGFNYVLVFGKLGFPALGIAGAAIGSVLSEAVSMVFYIVYTRYFTDFRKYGLFRRMKYSLRIQAEIFRVSSWTMIQFFFSCGTWLFFFIAIEHLGERSLAVSNLVRNSSGMLYMFVSAFATTGSAMVSNLMGAGKADEVMGLCKRIIFICTVTTLPLIIPIFIEPKIILFIFTNNPEIIADSVASLRIMLVSYIFGVPAYVYFLAIAGSGNTKATFWIEMVILAAYVAFTYYAVYVAGGPVELCWWVESVYGSSLLVICWAYLRRGRWKSKQI